MQDKKTNNANHLFSQIYFCDFDAQKTIGKYVKEKRMSELQKEKFHKLALRAFLFPKSQIISSKSALLIRSRFTDNIAKSVNSVWLIVDLEVVLDEL